MKKGNRKGFISISVVYAFLILFLLLLLAIVESYSSRQNMLNKIEVETKDELESTISSSSNENNDYIKSGLMLYYDGDRNTINGHVSNAVIWENLAYADYNGTIIGATWGSNYLSFDGNDYVSIAPINFQRPTVEVVFSVSSANTTNQSLFENFENGGSGVLLNSAGTTLYGQSYISSYRTLSTTITLNTTYSVSYTYTGSAINLYLNGVLKSTLAVSGAIGDPVNNTIYMVGANPSGVSASEFFKGKVYSVRLYNKSLTVSEIQHNYNLDRIKYGF